MYQVLEAYIRGNKDKANNSVKFKLQIQRYITVKFKINININFFAQPKRWPGSNNRYMRPQMPVKYTPNELYLMFNNYGDIRASGKCWKD